jgi:uncharacterized damage-inducible protein DinB
MRIIKRPAPEEYPAYSEMYMKHVPVDGMVLIHLKENLIELKKLIYSLPDEKLYYRYAEGKWTIKEILVHCIDDERIFVYRALCYARNDKTELPGFEQDDYTRYAGANERELDNIFEEYETVRSATITFFNGLPEEALMRSGCLTGNTNRRTVRAMAYHIAGHELHHLNIIREKYVE